MKRLSVLVVLVAAVAFSGISRAAEDGPQAPARDWSFQGIFGTYDRNALRRGWQVYEEVCSACHAMRFLSYRNLGDVGGPEFSAAEVKAIAARFTVIDGPDSEGDMFERAAFPKDTFAPPFPNDEAARSANGGALPPDLSLTVKADAGEGGPDHVHALLAGYADPPQGMEVPVGQYYNPYFSGGLIAMPPPLFEGIVDYTDGSPETVEQMASDVTHFLAWAAEPKMEERKRIGFQVMIFLILFSGLLYLAMRKVWSRQH